MSNDWFPRKRIDIIAMAQDWITVITAKYSAWNIPLETLNSLTTLSQTAQTIFMQAQSAERTAVITAQCKAAFDTLETAMRDTKKRCFLKPPLEDPDFVDLKLPIKDEIHTPVPAPTNQPGIEINKWAPHTLGFRRFTATDLGGSSADYGIRIYYGLVDPSSPAASDKIQMTRLTTEVYILSAPPHSPADLPNSFFTRRLNDLLGLPPEASGKICWMAARFENSKGTSGPWGTMINAVVP